MLGIQTATDAEVVSGLEEGELVVVSDRSGLKAGEEVRPKMIELVAVPGPGRPEVGTRQCPASPSAIRTSSS